MKTLLSFTHYVLKSDKRIINLISFSILSTLFQYLSLGMFFIFIKIEVSGTKFMQNNLSYLNKIFPLDEYSTTTLLTGLVLFMMVIFYFGYAYFSFVSKNISTKLITRHKNKITLNAQKEHDWSEKNFWLDLRRFFALYKSSFLAIAPIPIIICGLILIAILSSIILVYIIFSLFVAGVLYYFQPQFRIMQPKYSKEQMSNKRKFFAQMVSITLIMGILIIIWLGNFDIETSIIIILISRILLGNIINFIYSALEIQVNLIAFKKLQNNIKKYQQRISNE